MEENHAVQKFMEDYPFMTLISCNEEEYLGIVLNRGNMQTSIYVYEDIKTDELKKIFIDIGDKWWWHTNRMFPISIVFKKDMMPFRHCLKRFNSKSVSVLAGPETSLASIDKKRTKRKNTRIDTNLKTSKFFS